MMSTVVTAEPKAGSGGESSSARGDASPLARRVAREFGAPFGLLDLPRSAWLARQGADPAAFPRPEDLDAALSSDVAAQGRVVIHRQGFGEGPVWLCLPLPGTAWGDLVAVVGFAEAATPPGGTAWGPSCPEPALRAWGQAVSEQLRAQFASRARSKPSSSRTEGTERSLVAWLIRRLKISDPPERFQLLATNALRAALGVEAVAWLPAQPTEGVVVSGEVAGLVGHGYRNLVPAAPRAEAAHLANDLGPEPGSAARRVAAVATDSPGSPGWLVAVNPLDGSPFTTAVLETLQPAASLIATQQTNARIYADLKELLFGVIRALTAAIDAKDPYTSGHSERVARIAVRLAEELGMSANQRGDLYLMGLLHDVGKIGIDDNVLKKTGPLTPEEYRLIQSHVEIGVHILSDLRKLSHLIPGIRHHHESLDGSGYPAGLAGEAIPLEARVLAVADSFDAMSSTRPYRRRLSPGQIDEILQKGSGVQWDPRVVDALFACRADVEHIRQKGLGESLQAAVNGAIGRP